MDLMESIERQLRAFCASQPLFYAPMAILDPYGCERPDAHFGPPEIYCGPVLSSATTAASGGGGGAGLRPYVVRRMNSNHATGGVGGGSSSKSRRGGGASAFRPPGAVKPDKRGIHVVPKDQLVLPNKDGDVYVAEVLQRAKSRSMAIVLECGKRGEATLTTTKNEVCHICHNRKECGLNFHCGVHNYCDFHCAVRYPCGSVWFHVCLSFWTREWRHIVVSESLLLSNFPCFMLLPRHTVSAWIPCRRL